MKIDKAIVILDHYDDPLRQFTVKETKEATKLGREALKRFSVARKNKVDIRPTLLLGETKD